MIIHKKARYFTLSYFSLLCLLLFITNSCKEEETVKGKKNVINQNDSLFNQENLKYLENVKDFMEYFALMRKQKANYIDVIAKPELFEKVSDRKNMIIKFGILCSDIAYAKIIDNKTQMPEYDKLFNRYLKDLNISSFFKSDYKQYIDILVSK